MFKTFGVVVLNYNDYVTTQKFIDHVKNFKSEIQFVIVDNCSTNDSLEILTKYVDGLDNVEIIAADKNGGYAYGNNFGMKYLREKYNSKYLVVANPDTVIEERIFDKVKETFESTDYALLSPVMKNRDGSIAEVPYWDIPSFWDDVFGCIYIFRKLNKKKYVVDYEKGVQSVETLPGSLWFIKADILEEIGYLDENTFLYYEEIILSRKIRDRGFKCGLITSETYIHDHSVSIRSVMDDIRIRKIMGQSKLYYHKAYNGISGLRVKILELAIKLWIFERKIRKGTVNGSN